MIRGWGVDVRCGHHAGGADGPFRGGIGKICSNMLSALFCVTYVPGQSVTHVSGSYQAASGKQLLDLPIKE